MLGLRSRPVGARAHRRAEADARRLTHLLWALNTMLIFFALPWFATHVIAMSHRWYLALDALVSALFVLAFLHTAEPDMHTLTRRWRRSVAVGVIIAAVLAVGVVLHVEPTPAPTGFDLVLAIAGRGIALGVLSSAVMIVVPALIAAELTRPAPVPLRWFARAALTLVLTWAVASANTFGFDQFDDGNRTPTQATATIAAVPAALTGNPVGGVVAYTTLHVTVTLHAFETEVLIPPRVDLVRDYRPPGLFLPPELGNYGDRPIG